MMCGGAIQLAAADRRTVGNFLEGDLQIGFSAQYIKSYLR